MPKPNNNVIPLSKNISWIIFALALGILLYFLETPKLLEEVKIIYRYQSASFKVLYYILTFGLSIIGLTLLFFQRSNLIAYLILILFSILLLINLGYKELNGIGIQYEDILLLIQNRGFSLGDQAFLTFFPNLIKPFIICVLAVLGVIYLRKKLIRQRFKKYTLFVPALSMIMSSLLIYKTNANRLSIPSFYKIPSLILYTNQNNLYSLEREAPYELPILVESNFDHIVWIVDESVRGDHLQINSPDLKTTPFLDSIKNTQIINFGVASSGAVCSDYSHIMLMSGLRPDQLPDLESLSRKRPSIFQYAQKAGYNTNLIYSPGYEDKPKGYMTQSDFDYIDSRYQTEMLNPNLPAFQWDFKSLDYLSEIIDSNKKSFTYFLKYGAHFHYEHSYPSDQKIFNPTQDPTSFTRDNRQKLINSYHNALRWTVDEFFRSLDNSLKGKNALVIYTSDHGQNVMDHKDILLTHCVKEKAPQEMAAVPLFIYYTNDKMLETVKATKHPDQNKSHFNIFPTTLRFMGFDSLAINSYYYNDLFSTVKNKSNFISGDLYGRSRMYKNYFDQSRYKPVPQAEPK